MPPSSAAPLCLIIAGPNGAGKTTFAREFLPREAGILHFVNADLIAAGLAPLQPSQAALGAGRIFLHEIDRLAGQGANFSFESTLSGLAYLPRIRRWRAAGYRIEIIYLRLDSVGLALRRIAARVREGGHDVAATDVIRVLSGAGGTFGDPMRRCAMRGGSTTRVSAHQCSARNPDENKATRCQNQGDQRGDASRRTRGRPPGPPRRR